MGFARTRNHGRLRSPTVRPPRPKKIAIPPPQAPNVKPRQTVVHSTLRHSREGDSRVGGELIRMGSIVETCGSSDLRRRGVGTHRIEDVSSPSNNRQHNESGVVTTNPTTTFAGQIAAWFAPRALPPTDGDKNPEQPHSNFTTPAHSPPREISPGWFHSPQTGEGAASWPSSSLSSAVSGSLPPHSPYKLQTSFIIFSLSMIACLIVYRLGWI